MGHRSEIVAYKLSKVEDARLGRWTTVGYAQQVVGRAGTKSALTILFRCKECRPVPKDDFVWFLMRKRESLHTNPAPGAPARTAVLLVSMKLAPALSPCSSVKKRSRACISG